MDDISILNVYRYMKPIRSYFDKPSQNLRRSSQPSVSPHRPQRSQSSMSGAKHSPQTAPRQSLSRRSSQLGMRKPEAQLSTGNRKSQASQPSAQQKIERPPSSGTRRSQAQIIPVGQQKSQTPTPHSGSQKSHGPTPSGSRKSQTTSLMAGQLQTLSQKSQSFPTSNVQKPRLSPTESKRMSPTESKRMSSTESKRMSPTESKRMLPTESKRMSPTESKRMLPTESKRMSSTRLTLEPIELPDKLSEALYPPAVQPRMTATSMIELRASRFSYVYNDHTHPSAKMANPERRLDYVKKEVESEPPPPPPPSPSPPSPITTQSLIGSLTRVSATNSDGTPRTGSNMEAERTSATTPENRAVSPETHPVGASEATSSAPDEAQPPTNSSNPRTSSVRIPKRNTRHSGCILFTRRKNSTLFPDRHLNFVHCFWSNIFTNIQTLYFMKNYLIPECGFL